MYGLAMLFVGVFLAGASTVLAVFLPLWGGVALIASLIWIYWSLIVGLKRIERFYKGARGEEKVSEILRGLPDGYHVFNDFMAAGGQVDHVVAGPGGVFAIETKCWRGKVTVEDGKILLDGRPPDRSPLEQAVREAKQVHYTLVTLGWDGPVIPVVAFASDSFAAHRANVQGTVIINSNELRASFDTDRVVIPPAELERLVCLMDGVR